MAGDEPPAPDESDRERWQDRETEQIPRARGGAGAQDEDSDAEESERFVGAASVGPFYAQAEPPPISEEELGGLRGDAPPSSLFAAGKPLPLEVVPSGLVAQYLFPTEKFRGEWKRHWIQLVKEFAVGGVATILMGYVAGWLTKKHYDALFTAALIVWLIIMGWVLWRVADWFVNRFILTNKRVMVVQGLVTRNVAMMPLLRVTDMKYVQSPLGRLLGYGRFELESAGQHQALRTIKNLPKPNELYLRIVEEMYEPEAVEARLSSGVNQTDDGT